MRRLCSLACLAVASAIALPPAGAQERTFAAGSLIIPMDLTYQSDGMEQAYGLLFQLLQQGVPVQWVIDPEKTWHHAPCNTPGDECPWDCKDEGSGVKCAFPTASPDFTVAATVVWDDQEVAAPGAPIARHGYRGGPFVIAAEHRERALPIIDAWNDPGLWAANPWAMRSVFQVVTVHASSAPFTGFVKKQMLAAPTIAVFSDGNEDIATSYLRAAGIKQSNGAEFPSNKCGANNCGPGTPNPDMLTVPSIMGDMGTCDAPNLDHENGALFTEDGLPAYCQIMSMHWAVTDRETVECGGGNCPATPQECAGVPFTYHGHEVVAEVRSFLQYPVHFFAECQAVNAYENTVPNPAWPYLDDDGRTGHFLTTTGTPPACPCNPGPDEGEFECVAGGCGAGVDCCLPKDVKEKGAGFMVVDSPSPIQVLRPDIPYNQFDGLFGPNGGSEPAYNLSTFLGTQYKNDRDVTFITAADGPGVQDVWMTGYLDGACDIDEGPIINRVPGEGGVALAGGEGCGGKVSYLGGHSYAGDAGQRLFLNALFEADCVTAAGQPRIDLSLGELVVPAQTVPVEAELVVGYGNEGYGPALDAVLRAVVASEGVAFVSAEAGAVTPERASWDIGSISGTASLPDDPPLSGSRTATLRFDDFGSYDVAVELGYRVGLSSLEAAPETFTIRVLLDTDGDGVADEDDPSPSDAGACGDSDLDGCDDCSAGRFDPANDGPDANGDGLCDGPGAGGCGCGAGVGKGGLAPLLAGLLLALFAVAVPARSARRRRARSPRRDG